MTSGEAGQRQARVIPLLLSRGSVGFHCNPLQRFSARDPVSTRPIPLGRPRSSLLGDPVTRRLPEVPPPKQVQKRPPERSGAPPPPPYGGSPPSSRPLDGPGSSPAILTDPYTPPAIGARSAGRPPPPLHGRQAGSGSPRPPGEPVTGSLACFHPLIGAAAGPPRYAANSPRHGDRAGAPDRYDFTPRGKIR